METGNEASLGRAQLDSSAELPSVWTWPFRALAKAWRTWMDGRLPAPQTEEEAYRRWIDDQW